MDLFTQKFAGKLSETKLLPVICLKNENELNTFLDAILKSPIRCVEITLRHPFLPEAIKYIKQNHPEITVGAGTVKTVETLHKAKAAGADFCVAPGSVYEILTEAQKIDMPFLGGVSTPSECMKMALMGYETVKFFPAECMGGVKALKLFEGALSELKFLPTGGINADNFNDYRALKNVVACGGSFMVPSKMLEGGDANGILNTINSILGK